MKVAALIHFSMPWRCAGSESVAHELMKAAALAGHEATVYCTNRDSEHLWRGNEPVIELDGVTIFRVRNVAIGARIVADSSPDVILSHHQHSIAAANLARKIGARSVYCSHNDMQIVNFRQLEADPDLVIFNSDWVRESLAKTCKVPRESMTFHPPLTPERHLTDQRGDGITLVNLNADKGAHVFYKLSGVFPEKQFYGVVGGHGRQVIRRGLPNVEIIEHTPDMASVWGKTRVLLMPSVYESYGLVAQEAGLNGIPTIANNTPGLIENLGPRGRFADRDDLDAWAHQIRLLDDPDHYAQASNYATVRAQHALDATRDTLKRWVDWIG